MLLEKGPIKTSFFSPPVNFLLKACKVNHPVDYRGGYLFYGSGLGIK
jgi:hypothetical protein